MENNNQYIHRVTDYASLKQLKENANWFLALGIGLIILGVLAIIFSLTSTLVSVIYLGGFLIVIGIFEGIHSFKISKWSTFFLHLFLGVLYIIGGFLIVTNPLLNALTLTLLLAFFFIVAGILRTIFAFAKDIPHKGWVLFNGILTIILGVLIWKQWPYSGLWVIGTLVGIDAIFTGWTWIVLSSAAKKVRTEHHRVEIH